MKEKTKDRIKIVGGILAWLILLLMIPVLFGCLVNVVRFTYSMGYTGLIWRLIASGVFLVLAIIGALFYSHVQRHDKRKRMKTFILAVFCAILMSAYFQPIPTIRDLSSEPITETYRFCTISQKSFVPKITTNRVPVHSFRLSIFEKWLASVSGDYRYNVTITYYPNTHTRVSIDEIVRMEN